MRFQAHNSRIENEWYEIQADNILWPKIYSRPFGCRSIQTFEVFVRRFDWLAIHNNVGVYMSTIRHLLFFVFL